MKRIILLFGAIAATLMSSAENANETKPEAPKDLFSIRFGSVLAASIGCSSYTVFLTPNTHQVYVIGAMTEVTGDDIEAKMESAVRMIENELQLKMNASNISGKWIVFNNGYHVEVAKAGNKLVANAVCQRLYNVAESERGETVAKQSTKANQQSGNKVKSTEDNLWKAYRVFLDANYTSLKRDAEWQKFAGKQMTCTGRFQDAGNALFGGTYVTVIVDEKWVKLMIDPSEKDKVMSLQKGDQITVVGRVSSRGDLLHCITLENGKVIKQ